jgi:hypothetical protein
MQQLKTGACVVSILILLGSRRFFSVQEAMLLSVLNSKYPINTFAFKIQLPKTYEQLVDKLPSGSVII